MGSMDDQQLAHEQSQPISSRQALSDVTEQSRSDQRSDQQGCGQTRPRQTGHLKRDWQFIMNRDHLQENKKPKRRWSKKDKTVKRRQQTLHEIPGFLRDHSVVAVDPAADPAAEMPNTEDTSS